MTTQAQKQEQARAQSLEALALVAKAMLAIEDNTTLSTTQKKLAAIGLSAKVAILRIPPSCTTRVRKDLTELFTFIEGLTEFLQQAPASVDRLNRMIAIILVLATSLDTEATKECESALQLILTRAAFKAAKGEGQ